MITISKRVVSIRTQQTNRQLFEGSETPSSDLTIHIPGGRLPVKELRRSGSDSSGKGCLANVLDPNREVSPLKMEDRFFSRSGTPTPVLDPEESGSGSRTPVFDPENGRLVDSKSAPDLYQYFRRVSGADNSVNRPVPLDLFFESASESSESDSDDIKDGKDTTKPSGFQDGTLTYNSITAKDALNDLCVLWLRDNILGMAGGWILEFLEEIGFEENNKWILPVFFIGLMALSAAVGAATDDNKAAQDVGWGCGIGFQGVASALIYRFSRLAIRKEETDEGWAAPSEREISLLYMFRIFLPMLFIVPIDYMTFPNVDPNDLQSNLPSSEAAEVSVETFLRTNGMPLGILWLVGFLRHFDKKIC